MGGCCSTDSAKVVINSKKNPNAAKNDKKSDDFIKVDQNRKSNEVHISNEELEERRKIIEQQYKAKFEKDNKRGIVSKEDEIEYKLRQQKLKKVEEFEKQNPLYKPNFQYK